jgi:hypothetical protein
MAVMTSNQAKAMMDSLVEEDWLDDGLGHLTQEGYEPHEITRYRKELLSRELKSVEAMRYYVSETAEELLEEGIHLSPEEVANYVTQKLAPHRRAATFNEIILAIVEFFANTRNIEPDITEDDILGGVRSIVQEGVKVLYRGWKTFVSDDYR